MQKLQKFSNFIKEANVAQDFKAPKDSDDEVIKYKPRSKGEEEFVAQHKITKADAEPKGQEHIFKGDIKAVKEEVEQSEEKKSLEEGTLDTLRQIVKKKSAMPVKFKNGKKMSIDMQTANMIVKSFDKRIKKDDIKKKVSDMLDQSPEGLMKVLDIMNK
tara:strand:- start:1127 stop:1603 length:477 start_codon:yes stop_codon:yes gene_type:complete